MDTTNEGQGDSSHSNLYASIRNLKDIPIPIIVQVSSSEKSDRPSNQVPPQLERDSEVANGPTRVHSVTPKETRNGTSFTPRPRTAFTAPLRKITHRTVTATSEMSLLSESSCASSLASPINTAYASIHPAAPYSRGSWISGKSRPISTSRIVLKNINGRQAKESETILRNKFQIPLPTEDAYNEWRVGMEDPTEESRKLCDLSELLYEVEQEPPLDPHQPESEDVYKFNLVCGRIAEYCSNFVRMPTPPGFMVQCQITRSRQGINGLLYPTYFMHLENKNGVPGVMILTAVRSNLVKTDYVISTNPAEMSPKSEFCAGILQTNLWGSDCVLKVPVKSEKNGETCDEQKKEWEQLMSLKFESNALGIKGPRKLSVAIPKLKSDWEQCHPGSFTFPPNDEDTEQVAIVKNRAPRWSEDTCTYVLNFSSRVQRSSVKNFQLEYQIKGSDFTLLQFGRCNRSKNFILDFSYPFCPLQAFAIALTSFDVKWGLD